jgi:HK97 family phage prohead protease
MGDTIRKQFVDTEVRTVRGRVRRFTISTGAADRDNDTISPAGWRLDNYRRNPVVLWAHDYTQLPLGKAIDIHVEDQALVADAEFANHTFADTVLQMIDGGFLRATSVGFKPEKAIRNDQRGGTDFIEQELLEFSIVPVPANPEAVRHFKALNLWRDTEDVVVELLTAGPQDDVEVDEPVYSYEQIANAYRALGTHRRSEPFEPIYVINATELRAMLHGVVRQAIGDIVREATTSTIRRRLGKVD